MIHQLTVVVPIFNEEDNLNALFKRLSDVLLKLSLNYEVIFINDGSTDRSLTVLQRIARKNNFCKVINFSRNFGHMSAIFAGLVHAKGRYIIIMDGDLQDPPEVIPSLLIQAKKGFDVVYAIKEKRKENLLRRFLFASYYNVLSVISQYKMPSNAGTFSLISAKVAKLLIELPERNKYLSGLRAWVGFSQTGVVYERDSRHSGKPASFRRLMKLALDGIVSFSYIPLRMASILGFICASAAFVSIMLILLLRTFFQIGIVGWASTMSTILLMGGIQLITLGIIGEYLARIYDEVKKRPDYIISSKINF